MLGKFVLKLLDIFRRLQQRLRGDTADIQAGAAQRHFAFGVFPAFDARHTETQLRGANRRDISAGAGTNNNNIKLF